MAYFEYASVSEFGEEGALLVVPVRGDCGGNWGRLYELPRHYPFDLHVFRGKALSERAGGD